MALVLKDRVKEQTTTTGTGTVTLGGAISGFDTFASVGNGNTTYYAIVSQSANEWEVGIGTYTASGTTLSRDTILESSNSDSAVNFSAGTKDVFVTYPADKSVYADAAGTVNTGAIAAASLTLTTDLAVADGGTGASSLTDGGVLLGSGTGAITPMAVLTDGQMIVGDGSGDPVAESGATLRTSIGVDAAGTDNSTNVTLAGSLDYLTLSGQEITRGAIVLTTDVSGTLPIANGGTNATSAGAALTSLGAAPAAGSSNIVTTGALNSGSITSGFGAIDNGSSNITTTGVGTFASLDISGNVDVDGTLETDALSIASTTVTSTAAELNILDGVTSTAAEINLLDAVARGKIIYGNASGASALLAPGGANTVLTSDGTDISWAAAGAASSVAADNISAGDAAVLLTTSSGNITIDAASNDSDIILKGTDGGADTTFLTIDGSAAGAAAFNSTVTMTGLVLGSTAVTSTAAELNILDGATVVVGEINALDLGATAVGTAIASKAVILDSNKDYTGLRNLTLSGELDAGSLDVSGNADIDGTLETDALSINGTTVTSTAAELNILDGVTSTAAELNILDGVTSTAAELNILDGVTSTTAELNILDGVTSTAAELNILDGVTSTTAELNILDGVTSTAAELNLVDAIARGKILYGNASGASALLSPGSNTQVLTSDGTDISWADASGGGATSINGLSDAATSGNNALYLGNDAGNGNTSANTGVGQLALSSLNSGIYGNTAIGQKAGKSITSGLTNTCLGYKAGEDITTGPDNIIIGPDAAKTLTTGSDNIVIGSDECGENLSSGINNTIIGPRAGKATATNTECIIIGFNANPSSNSVTDEITLGDTGITKFRIPGINWSIKDTTATEDYVLTVDASGEAGWEAAAAGGKVLQVVQGSTQTQVNSTSTTYADTTLTAAITPSASGSKILVLVSQSMASAGGAAGGQVAILRGSTVIEEFSQVNNAENQQTNHYLPFLDSPSTTDATTYKTQIKRIDQSGTLQAQRNDSSGNATSIITLMEIGA